MRRLRAPRLGSLRVRLALSHAVFALLMVVTATVIARKGKSMNVASPIWVSRERVRRTRLPKQTLRKRTKRNHFIAVMTNVRMNAVTVDHPVNPMQKMKVDARSGRAALASKDVIAKKIRHGSLIAAGKILRVRVRTIVHPIPIRLLQNYWP